MKVLEYETVKLLETMRRLGLVADYVIFWDPELYGGQGGEYLVWAGLL